MPGIILARNIDVVVASSGGVGSTLLLEEISKYKRTHRHLAIDYYKHLSIPPISFRRNVKYVYVFGDPVTASISLFKRGFHHQQSVKLNRYRSNTAFIIPEKMTLEEYAAKGRDGFQYEEQLRNWCETFLAQPTFFIRYDQLYESLPALAQFLELPPQFLEDFPPEQQRQSGRDVVSEETFEGLTRIYAGHKLLHEMEGCEIHDLTDRPAKHIFKRPYRQAILESHFTLPLKAALLRYSPSLFRLAKKTKRALVKR